MLVVERHMLAVELHMKVVENRRKVVLGEELECWLVPGFDRLQFERLEHMNRPCPCVR